MKPLHQGYSRIAGKGDPLVGYVQMPVHNYFLLQLSSLGGSTSGSYLVQKRHLEEL